MVVRDIDRSVDFYTRVMGLTVMERSPSGTVFMSANTEKSHELAIRAIGMDAGGPDHSIIGQAHMAWQMENFEDCRNCTTGWSRTKYVSCDRATTEYPWSLLPGSDDNEIEVYYELPRNSGLVTQRRVCSGTSSRAPWKSRWRRPTTRPRNTVCGRRLRTYWTPSPSEPGFSAPVAVGTRTLGNCGLVRHPQWGPVTVLAPEELPDDARVVCVGGIGAPTVGIEKVRDLQSYHALRAIEDFTGGKATALISNEIGGSNSVEPLIPAAMAGLPVVTPTVWGEPFPELQMKTFFVYGVPCCPMAIADERQFGGYPRNN